MSRRHELTDDEWALLAPLLPADPPRGGRWRDHRTTVSGILYRERTGIPWRDLPERFGPWKTVYQRKRRWAMDGTWSRICAALRIDCDAEEGDEWTVGVDTSSIRAHQHAAGARRPSGGSPKKGEAARDEKGGREALGRSRGGLTTKLHLAADRRCRPIARHTTCGQRADCTGFTQVMAAIRIPRRVGRPRTRPGHVLADKAYSSKAIRSHLRRRGIKATIPIKADQAANRREKGSRGGRPPNFDRERYKQRNTAERAFNKLKQFRAVATRYDKRDYMYQATVDIATMKIWLRDLTQDRRDTA
ncbi:IS5 family transposase [Micromonospora olivasterospora]|uniref:IS5 family transposase n=1 Tax=Micromonospora olivasterospora TaxID=1880 RepID=UPI003CCC869F